MTSAYFNLNKYCVMEYLYSDISLPTTYSSSLVNLKVVTNNYTKLRTVINDDLSTSRTLNVSRYTTQRLPDGNMVLLDSTSGYYYPAYDTNIVIDNIVVSPPQSITYDTVRIHILSGYNFQNLDGFIISLSIRNDRDEELQLCEFNFLKSDSTLLYFNPKPLKLSDLVYDKYVELKILSTNSMLIQQNTFPSAPNNVSGYVTGGRKIANRNTIYCNFVEISNSFIKNGILYMSQANAVKFPFDSYDKFDLLEARIRLANNGNYFEYYAAYNGTIIESFIFALNAFAGNKFYIIHDIRTIEQIGSTFVETDNMSSIQIDKYGQPKIFRPILQSSNAVSFTLEYTVRLYNKNDGRSIFKTATLTSMDVNLYGKKIVPLSIGNVDRPLKIYNQVLNQKPFTINDNTVNIVKTTVVNHFINQNSIVADNGNGGSVTDIILHPFSNILGFTISQINQSNNTNVKFVLDNISEYKMAFIKNDGSKLYINEYIIPDYQHVDGRIAFLITDANMIEIAHYNNSNYYIVASSESGETVIYHGTYHIS